MVLSGSSLFPQALLPLHLFESRYRLMLKDALDSHRCFAIANREGDSVRSIGGVGLVRACVSQPDGTFHLVLQGLHRVRFYEWDTALSYPSAMVQVLESSHTETEKAHNLAREISGLCGQLQKLGLTLPEGLDECIASVQCSDVLSDVISSTLLADPEARQKMLEELDTERRLSFLVVALRKLIDQTH
jgi:Lon protease-like protein